MTAILFALALTSIVVYLNERHGLLAGDRFPSFEAKIGAYVWLGLLTWVISALVIESSGQAFEVDPATLNFWSLFSFHLIIVIFLAGWWLLTSRPPVDGYLSLWRDEAARWSLLGAGVGVAGWALTIAIALVVGVVLTATGLVPDNLQPSPMIPWMAGLPVWKKILIILSAMTFEEAFFRGWLQKRIGLVPSTIIFALAHAGYGQPMMLIGITVISLIIGITFYATRRLLPCIVAHGVFDAIQLFVIVPFALKFSGMG